MILDLLSFIAQSALVFNSESITKALSNANAQKAMVTSISYETET